jgi:PAS domain S-box-containing protein
MYERKLPQDPEALRRLAAERLQRSARESDPSAQGTGAAERIRELELQVAELQLQLEEAARVNDLLAAAVNCAPDAIFIKDLEGKYRFLNPAAATNAGLPPEEVLGCDDRRLYDDRSAAEIQAADQAILSSGEPHSGEHRVVLGDQERTYWFVKAPLRDAQGNVIGVVGAARDITQAKESERKLRESEARYRTFVEHVTDALFLHSEDGEILDVNQRACDSLGYSREELIGQWPYLFDPDVTPEILQSLNEQLRADCSVSIETRHRRKDGTTFPVEVRVRPFRIDGQRYSISLVQDITQRKQAEQELRASEQRFRELADAIPQIVWIAAPDGGMIHLNARASEYSGVSVEDLTGWSWERVIHPDDIAATLQNWSKILQTGEPKPLEFRIRNVSGDYRWHIARQVPSRDADGRIVFWYGTCTDIEDYKRAEDALRASEERYRTLFHSIPDPMFVFDPATLHFLAVNDAATAKYGFSRTEFLQMTIRDIHLPAELQELATAAQGWECVFSGRESWQHRTRSGAVIDVEITAHSLNLDQRPVCIVLARDVTDRRRVEAEVRRTTELLRVVTEGTPDAVFVKDREGKYLLFNPAAERFVGKPASEVLGKDDTAIFGPEDATLVMQLDRRVLETEEAITNEETLTAAGTTRTYLAMKAPYRDSEGRVIGTIGVSRDITERKRAEEAFRKISALHETIIRTAAEGIGLCTPTADGLDLHFSVWNDQLTAITGYTREEINERGCLQTLFQDPRVRERIHERIRKLIAGETLEPQDWEILRRDGKRRTLSLAATYVESNEKTPQFVVMVQDVTERRRQAEELAARQAELRHVSRLNTVGQMVAALSHEVAQPLAAISNYAASSAALIGAKEHPRWELVKQHIDQITQQSRRAADIIQRIREYCRKTTPARAQCDVNELLKKSVEMLSLELRAANIALEWDLTSQVPPLPGDRVQLQQVFVNLLLNARDALLEVAPERRMVTLRTQVTADAVLIDVEDNGIGLSDDIASQLFEPFVTTKPDGMGIGLSICRSILQEHRGDISYHHRESGGVTFRVRLALPSPAAPA